MTICHKCFGMKAYQYTTSGTPHFKLCEQCCKHDQGWFQLDRHYGENNGKLCCNAGCGTVKEDTTNSFY